MDEKEALKAAQTIEEKIKLPKEVKDVIDKTFFYNNIMAILIMIYFAIINLSYIYLKNDAFERAMKYLAMFMLIGTIVVFEIAYNKDNFKIGLIGIEMLICGLLSVYIPYIYLYTAPIYRYFMMIIPIFFAVYYIAKTIIVYIMKNIKHKNSISDIKEIINYDENESYINEKSTKTLRENKKRKEQEQALRKKKMKNINETNKTQKNIKTCKKR